MTANMNIEVKKSPVHGLGVFAHTKILAGDVIEVCHVLAMTEKECETIDTTMLYNYNFSWKDKGCALALGFGSIYNHSYEPNAIYKKDLFNNTLTFTAIKTINAGEEVTISYNGDPSDKDPVWFDK